MTTLYCDIYNLAITQIADLIKKDYKKKYNTVATSQYIEFALGKKNIQDKIFSRIIEMILTVFKEVSVIKQLILDLFHNPCYIAIFSTLRHLSSLKQSSLEYKARTPPPHACQRQAGVASLKKEGQ